MADNPLAAFFGYLLIAAGGLITLLSGLCSGVFLIGMVQSISHSTQAAAGVLPAFGLVFVFGGVPLAGGIGLIILGLMLVRRPRPPRPPPLG